MQIKISFFEIPATDYSRAVAFYQNVFGCELNQTECGPEKMAFFPSPDGQPRGAISLSEGFTPSPDGVLIHLETDDIDRTLARVAEYGGKIIAGKKAIEGDKGYFALFTDSEGNRLGVYSGR